MIDTNLYIDLIRAEENLGTLEAIYERGSAGLYISSIVAAELWAGAQDATGRRAVQKLIAPFERHGRILTPTHRDWTIAGRLLSRILVHKQSLKSKVAALSNDCLLAVSAQFAGASVYTRNADDFRLIQGFFQFSLVVVRTG